MLLQNTVFSTGRLPPDSLWQRTVPEQIRPLASLSDLAQNTGGRTCFLPSFFICYSHTHLHVITSRASIQKESFIQDLGGCVLQTGDTCCFTADFGIVDDSNLVLHDVSFRDIFRLSHKLQMQIKIQKLSLYLW